MDLINLTTSVPSVIEEIYPILKKRKLLEEYKWEGWDFSLYFGPTIPSDNSETDVTSLCYCMHATTGNMSTSPKPAVPTDGGGILITFNNKGIATWTYQTKEETFEKVSSSFDNKFYPRRN